MYTPVTFYRIKNMAKDVKSFSVVMCMLVSGNRAEVLDKEFTNLLMADGIKVKFGTVNHMATVN